jgi:hypothetical protein
VKASSLFAAGLAILPLCCPSGTAMSRTATPSGVATTSLPDIVVEAPKQAGGPLKPKHRAVARSTVSPRTSPSTPTPSASPMSPELVKLANATGSCVGGCVTSFRSGDAPWHGCSWSSGFMLSSTCRNTGNFKTYAECREAGLITGWRENEVPWYCSSLALK